MEKFRKNVLDRIAFKSIFGVVMLLVIFSMLVSAIGFNDFTDVLMTQYSESAFKTAEISSTAVDPDKMDEYLASGGTTEEYLSVLAMLDRICNGSGSTFVYVIQPDTTDYAHIKFVFSAMNKDSHFTHYDFGYVRETTNDEYRRKYRALYEEGSRRELLIRDRGYIETAPHITAMVPLTGEDGTVKGILCVQWQMEAVAQARKVFVRKVLITMILVALFVIAGQIGYLKRQILRPLELVTEEASRFATENVQTGRKLRDQIHNRDEIGQLAQAIDQMEEQIHNYVERITAITAEEEKIKTELSLAAHIQEDMLPSVFPPFPDRHEFDIYASMDPAKEVGGDFYDFFMIDEDHLCLIMADVSGKGIPAALFMMASKIILADNVIQGKSPAEALKGTNDILCVNNREEMFVTVWLGILEISTGKVKAANAGHEYPVIQKAGADFEILMDKHGFVIGGMEGVKYKEYEFTLSPGDKLFLYTDGLPEATNSEEEMFGVDGMMNALNEMVGCSPKEILEHITKETAEFVGDAPQFDDLTMLCLDYYGVNAGGKPVPPAES